MKFEASDITNERDVTMNSDEKRDGPSICDEVKVAYVELRDAVPPMTKERLEKLREHAKDPDECTGTIIREWIDEVERMQKEVSSIVLRRRDAHVDTQYIAALEARNRELEAVLLAKHISEAPPCPYGSGPQVPNHTLLARRELRVPYHRPFIEEADVDFMRRVLLVSGSIGDYAAYEGIGPVEWVRDHGAKLPFAIAKGFFEGIDRRRYREE